MSESDKIRIRAYVISFGVSVALLLLKFYAYRITGSEAIRSDAFESIVNALTPMTGLIFLTFARKPADHDHPYGHGKLEYFSSGIEGGLVFFAALVIIFLAVKRLAEGQPLHDLDHGFFISAAAGIVNLMLGYFILRVGRKHGSAALRANGVHILSDVWTTVGVLIGLALVRITGHTVFDALAAIVVGILLGHEGYKIIREASAVLLDEKDPALIRIMAELFNKHRRQGIIYLHYTRVIRPGEYHHIDSHVVVPEFWDVMTAHKETNIFEHKVIRDYPNDGEIHFHIDPCRRAYCVNCDYCDCPVRQEPFEKLNPFTVESLLSPIEPDEE